MVAADRLENTSVPASVDALDEAIVSLSRTIDQSTYRLLVLIREFDERAGWLKWATTSCAEWLPLIYEGAATSRSPPPASGCAPRTR